MELGGGDLAGMSVCCLVYEQIELRRHRSV